MAYITDSQQANVYRWEADWKQWNVKSLTRLECVRLVKHVCTLYDIPTCPVRILKQKPGLRWGTHYDPDQHLIRLSPPHMNPAVVLHETAHAVHSVIAGNDAHEAHGPEWMAVYIGLLVRFGLAPKLALIATSKAHGLRTANIDKHNPLRIRRTYRALRAREAL